ncbi:MAG: ABC transporter ATP-binding protein [Candidatus Margulisiibacteriota bacterium]
MVECKSLSFRYTHKSPLFENLNLSLSPGHMVGLLGKNGAGKTTLLKLMAGFLKPQAGYVSINQLAPFDRSLAFLDQIAFVPEDFKLPDISIRDLSAKYGVFYSKFDASLFKILISKFDLDPTLRLRHISFGQGKKAFLAFAIALQPSILFLDEPTNALDIPAKQMLRTMLLEHLPEQSLAIISTHQVREISNLVSQVAILDQGRMILNLDIATISTKISMSHTQNIPNNAHILFSEPALGGHLILTQRNSGPETEIDLELLFKAVSANPDIFQNLYSEEACHA